MKVSNFRIVTEWANVHYPLGESFGNLEHTRSQADKQEGFIKGRTVSALELEEAAKAICKTVCGEGREKDWQDDPYDYLAEARAAFDAAIFIIQEAS